MILVRHLLAVSFAVAASGCRTVSTAPVPRALPMTASLASSSPPASPPVTAVRPAGDAPVYRNPTIGVVQLRAYQDAEGRLFGPQAMYQVSHPGGWNIEALEKTGAVVAANVSSPPPVGPISPVSVEGTTNAVPPSNRTLLDIAQAGDIALTGLMREADKAQADAMARAAGNRTAVFDAEAGWFLLPRDRASPP